MSHALFEVFDSDEEDEEDSKETKEISKDSEINEPIGDAEQETVSPKKNSSRKRKGPELPQPEDVVLIRTGTLIL